MSFSSLGLSEALARAVAAAGYNQPTPVQQRAIPAVLQGRDLMVAAQTGTGKTGGFALPILERLFPAGQAAQPASPRQARVLVLTPTRELAAQVHDSFKLYARDLPLSSACIFGGVGMNPQIQALAQGVQVLVACPGRLLDLVGQQKVDLSRVEILVLDEADRMLDMGFIHDVKKVLARLPAERQNLLFSATFSSDIVELANRLLRNPERIEVTPPNTTVERIEQRVFRLPTPQKRALLAHLVTLGAWEQVLVFTRTKHGANRLAEYLSKQGLPAAAIHGNKSQNARTKALADFKANEVRILVATDIAARGLDIDQLPHVVNYELPNVEEDYVHRIGRTGRAGRSGEAISLVAPDEERLLKAIERLTKQQIPDGDMLGFDLQALAESPAESAENESQRRERPRRSGPAGKNRQTEPSTAKDTQGEVRQARRNPRGKRRSEAPERPSPQPRPARPLTSGTGRDPEEFLDDDYDNFGNRADYVSPYPDKEQPRSQRRRNNSPQGQNPKRVQEPGQKPARTATPKAAARPNKGAPNKASKRNGKAPPSRMSDAPLREPSEYAAAKPTRQPVVINKRDLLRVDRLPTAEQLDELEPRRKSERPALLTRNR